MALFEMSRLSKEIAIAVGGGVCVAAAAATWYRNHSMKNPFPNEWMEIGVVGDLWIYPLKSGRAMEVEDAECTETGLILQNEKKCTLKDRGLLVYSEVNGEYRTARNYPTMVLVSVVADDQEHIKFEAPGMKPVIIKVPSKKAASIPCTTNHGEPLRCVDCGDEIAEWISQYCLKNGKGLRVGMCTDNKRKVTNPPWPEWKKVYDYIRNEDLGIYSDLSSYMIMNQASLENLNERLLDSVTPLNFRPNIIVQGPEAYDEDNWDWIKIGEDVVFRNIKPCTRCIMVNIDPETGIRIPDQKVLKELKEYRQLTDPIKRELEGSSPIFGVYAGIYRLGRIKLGDKVYVGKQ